MDESVYTNPLNSDTYHVSLENGTHKATEKEAILTDECVYAGIDDDVVRNNSAKSLAESESDMEFRMVQPPGSAAHGEYIYAVVSKDKRNSPKSEQFEYSNIGPNGSVRSKSTAAPNLSHTPFVPVHFTSHEEYDSLDDVVDAGENFHDQANKNSTKNGDGFKTFSSTLSIATTRSNVSGASRNSSVNGSSHRYKFPAVFLGSMVVDLEKLKDNKNEYLVSCIQSVAAQTSEATTMIMKRASKNAKPQSGEDVTLSTHRGMNVIIVLDGGHVKVVEKKSNSTRLDIPLNIIRLWGTGKGSSSREFAIISKDLIVKSELCRVFLCEIPSQTVANIFRDVCNQMATQKVEGHGQKPTSANPETLKKTASIGSIPSAATVRSSRSEGSQPSNSSLRDVTKCYYLGMIEIDKSTGTKVVERAIDLVGTYVSKEFWLNGKLLTNSDGVFFVSEGTCRLSCPNSSITFVGPSIKHKSLVGIIVRKNDGTFAHIFFMEKNLCQWFENMKFICKLHSSKFDKSIASTLNKRARNHKT